MATILSTSMLATLPTFMSATISPKFTVSRLEDQTCPLGNPHFGWRPLKMKCGLPGGRSDCLEDTNAALQEHWVKLESCHWCQVDLRCGGTQWATTQPWTLPIVCSRRPKWKISHCLGHWNPNPLPKWVGEPDYNLTCYRWSWLEVNLHFTKFSDACEEQIWLECI